MPHAVRMIRNEHRDYLQVLECLCRLLDRLEERGDEKRRLLFLILDYVEAFPATFHHPKEEDYLFAPLGRRRPDCGPLLERLLGSILRMASEILGARPEVVPLDLPEMA